MMNTVERYKRIDIANLSIQGTDETIKQHINISNHKIKITSTRPNYGGLRWWFVCPLCQKKKRVLYLSGDDYYCRECLKLSYKSQTYRNRYDALSDEYFKLLHEIYKLKWQIDPEAMQGFINVYEPSMPAYTSLDFIPEQPYTMRLSTYEKYMRKLFGMLERMRQVNRFALEINNEHAEIIKNQIEDIQKNDNS